MKFEPDDYYEKVGRFEPNEVLRIATKYGHFRIKEMPDGNLEINFAGIGEKQAIAVLPKVTNVIELKPVNL